MKNDIHIDTIADAEDAPESSGAPPKESARLLELPVRSADDPPGDPILVLAESLRAVCARMEALTCEMNGLARAAAGLIERRSMGAVSDPSTLIEQPSLAEAAISTRERDVLRLLLGGKGNREISLALGVSEKTVKNHLWRIYRKLGVRSRTQLFHNLTSRLLGCHWPNGIAVARAVSPRSTSPEII
jgi:DNA-binding NarL/FixJ family response regulator